MSDVEKMVELDLLIKNSSLEMLYAMENVIIEQINKKQIKGDNK